MKRVKQILIHEEINQVGSYVWSHLRNMAKSSSPIHVVVQSLLVDEHLQNKFKLDIRKFSRNFDHSVFFDKFNFGTRSDANVIFGMQSFLPRQVAWNFTAELFGEAVNLFELSARMEGFDKMAESILGPFGSMNPTELKRKIEPYMWWTENLEFMNACEQIFKNYIFKFKSRGYFNAYELSYLFKQAFTEIFAIKF